MASLRGPHHVRTPHMACTGNLTQNVRTKYGLGPFFSQNLFGLSPLVNGGPPDTPLSPCSFSHDHSHQLFSFLSPGIVIIEPHFSPLLFVPDENEKKGSFLMMRLITFYAITNPHFEQDVH